MCKKKNRHNVHINHMINFDEIVNLNNYNIIIVAPICLSIIY